MENKFLVGFTIGFVLAFLGGLLIDSSDGGFWGKVILLLVGAIIFAALWFVRKRPDKK